MIWLYANGLLGSTLLLLPAVCRGLQTGHLVGGAGQLVGLGLVFLWTALADGSPSEPRRLLVVRRPLGACLRFGSFCLFYISSRCGIWRISWGSIILKPH